MSFTQLPPAAASYVTTEPLGTRNLTLEQHVRVAPCSCVEAHGHCHRPGTELLRCPRSLPGLTHLTTPTHCSPRLKGPRLYEF